jgi:replication fork clamp-binding protein CrfC
LPGITKISVGNQNEDIEGITTKMAHRYCKEERTIILAVVPANADMATSQGLHLARQWDPEGVRTLGVITKIDIMDRGTDASGMILNREVPLRLGYVGVKNRSQEDINNKVKVAIALAKED